MIGIIVACGIALLAYAGSFLWWRPSVSKPWPANTGHNGEDSVVISKTERWPYLETLVAVDSAFHSYAVDSENKLWIRNCPAYSLSPTAQVRRQAQPRKRRMRG